MTGFVLPGEVASNEGFDHPFRSNQLERLPVGLEKCIAAGRDAGLGFAGELEDHGEVRGAIETLSRVDEIERRDGKQSGSEIGIVAFQARKVGVAAGHRARGIRDECRRR